MLEVQNNAGYGKKYRAAMGVSVSGPRLPDRKRTGYGERMIFSCAICSQDTSRPAKPTVSALGRQAPQVVVPHVYSRGICLGQVCEVLHFGVAKQGWAHTVHGRALESLVEQRSGSTECMAASK